MKTLVLSIGLFLVLGITILQAQIPTLSIIGKYSFAGNANDESEEIGDATVYGATLTENRCGLPDNAYHFSNSSQYIEIPNLRMVEHGELSFSMWAKADILTSNCMMMMYPDNWSDRCVMCAEYLGSPTTLIWDFGDCDYIGRSVVDHVNFDTYWHHYVFIVSYEQNLKQIYRDNFCIYSSGFDGYLSNYGRTVYVGAGIDWSGGDIGFKGSIDDIRIYNRPLNSEEVSLLYHEEGCYTGFTEKPEAVSFEIAPNPASSNFKVLGLKTSGKIELINSEGNVVVTELVSESETSISVIDLPAGIYTVRMISENKVGFRKLVKL